MPSIAAEREHQAVGGVERPAPCPPAWSLGIAKGSPFIHRHQSRHWRRRCARSWRGSAPAASGFFFCRHDRRPGREAVGQLHEAETAPRDQITSSSAKRDRCIAQIEAAARKFERENPGPRTASRRIGRGPVGSPRARGRHLAVDSGKEACRQGRQQPRGHSFSARRASMRRPGRGANIST